jgi:pimeloyl-ACP methyl ester carboxylesterase
MVLVLLSALFALVALPQHIDAQNASSPFPQSTTCGEQCQNKALLGIAFEDSQHAHTPLDDFYTIPTNFSPSMKPGVLLRVEAYTDIVNYTVPSSLTMSRIVYTSESLNGTVVPASAFVLWPYAPFDYSSYDRKQNRVEDSSQDTAKFPIVAWAHGTSGQFASCAPSNYRSLQYHFMTSYSLAMEGFAVVAADYAGLGVTSLPNGEQSHAYLAGPAGANDVAYAVEAARKAFPSHLEAEGPFVTMGHSQGGNVAWAFSERQAVTPVPGYRGTIAFSPPPRAIDAVEAAVKMAASVPVAEQPLWVPLVLNLQPMIIAAITAVYPSYNFSGMSAVSFDLWNNVLKSVQGCLPTSSLIFADIPPVQLAKAGWTNDSTVQEWQDRVGVSGHKFKGPLLVIAGSNDVIPTELLEKAVDASCHASGKESLEMMIYEEMEHFPSIQASRMKWMEWVKDRIIGGDAAENAYPRRENGTCGKKTVVNGFNTNYTEQSISPNWLVEWVPMQPDGWHLSL